MEKLHYAWARTQLKTRAAWLTTRHKHCEFDLLLGIEQKLYGHLVYLQEAMPEPDLTDDETRVLNLCIAAFRPDFRDDPDRLAAIVTEAGVEAWLDDLQTAIDITGVQNWQPLLHSLAGRKDLADTTRWWLNGRAHGYPSGENLAAWPGAWSDATPGQIPCLIKHQEWQPDTLAAWLPAARDCVQQADRQDDLHWLVLGLLAAGKREPAMELISLWTTANPGSWLAWSAAAASGANEFIQPLQQAVLEERIPPFFLVVHGDTAHLDFCIDLLAQPHTNPLAERAWYGFTGERLPRVPAITLGGKKKGDRLADAHTARHWLDRNQPTGRLCLGNNCTESPFRPQLGRFFGTDTEPVASATWVDTQGRVLLNPTECHWQRAQRIREARA